MTTALALLWLLPAAGPDEIPRTPAVAIRGLTPSEAARHSPVRLRRIILYADAEHLFLHDDSGPVYVASPAGAVPLPAGRAVEVVGTTDIGDSRVFVRASGVRDLGPGRL